MKKITGFLSLVLITALGFFFVHADNVRAADKKGKQITVKQSFQPHTTQSTETIAAPVKLCSGVLAPNWRDTITVPDTWKGGTCQSFAWSIGTNSYQLGCANANSFSWGDFNGGTPPDDQCKW